MKWPSTVSKPEHFKCVLKKLHVHGNCLDDKNLPQLCVEHNVEVIELGFRVTNLYMTAQPGLMTGAKNFLRLSATNLRSWMPGTKGIFSVIGDQILSAPTNKRDKRERNKPNLEASNIDLAELTILMSYTAATHFLLSVVAFKMNNRWATGLTAVVV